MYNTNHILSILHILILKRVKRTTLSGEYYSHLDFLQKIEAQRAYSRSHSQLMTEPGSKPRQPGLDLALVTIFLIPPLMKRGKGLVQQKECQISHCRAYLEIRSKFCHKQALQAWCPLPASPGLKGEGMGQSPTTLTFHNSVTKSLANQELCKCRYSVTQSISCTLGTS